MKKIVFFAFFVLMACSFAPKQLDQSMWDSSLNGATFKAMDTEGKMTKKNLLRQNGYLPLSPEEANVYVRNQEKMYAQALEPAGIIVQRAGPDLILVVFDEIAFIDNRFIFKDGFYKQLDFIIKSLKEFNRSYVGVIGYTDAFGEAADNQRLSVLKAKSIASYLANNGIIPYRIFVDGKGENYPIADNNSVRGRSLNKRVEIRISPIFE